MLYHYPIVKADDSDLMVEFCHIDENAVREQWKKERLICLDGFKINIFMEGAFSVFVDGKAYTPTFGDVCLLAPNKIHSGHIASPMHINYFQLDIGRRAFDALPCGDMLMKKLLLLAEGNLSFAKPSERNINSFVDLCFAIESAIENEDMPVAFAKCVELISKLCELYGKDTAVPTGHISPVTKRAIRYIEENFGSGITLECLAGRLGVSASYLSRIFKHEVGMGVHAYLTEYRIIKSALLLKSHPIAQVCYLCGFADSSHFISVFKKHYSMTPKQYMKRFQDYTE
ncbi:MAG: helix-turn-helix transcriptional regulator [Clostridia bacterium]|nr:helix-turn-helix transcriptional regulator [Clostridia bacterium]